MCYERADHNPYGRWFSEALELIDHRYVEKVDDQKLFDGALVGMVRRLDDYSSFLTRSESPRFEEDLNQKYGGVGIEVNLDGPDRLLTVANPRVGGPAYEAGVRAGDRIVTIDGRATDKMELPEIVNLLRGQPGRTGHDLGPPRRSLRADRVSPHARDYQDRLDSRRPAIGRRQLGLSTSGR